MKLPGRTEGAVQELTSVDPGVYAQRGQAIGGAMDVVQDIGKEMFDREVASQTLDAILAISNKEVELTEDYGDKRNFTAAEMDAMGIDVPDDMRTRTWIDSHGDEQSEDRTDIPAEEFMPQYRKEQLEKEVALRAKSITGSTKQAEFLARQQEAIDRQYEIELGTAQVAREERLNSKYDAQLANAEAAGSYDLARQLARDHPTMNDWEKDQEVARLYEEEEKRYLANKRDHGTDGQLREELARLTGEDKAYGQDEDGDFHNSMDLPTLRSEIAALRSTLKAREADRKALVKGNKAQVYSSTVDLILDPEASFEEGANAISEGVASGMITASQSDALKALQADRGKINPARDKTHVLEALAADDPGAFIDTDLREYRGFVDEGQLKTYQKRQDAMKDNRGRASSQEQLRKMSMVGLDLDPTDQGDIPKLMMFDTTVQALLDNYQTKNGVPPAGRDLRDIYTQATQAVRSFDAGDRFVPKGGFWKQDLAKLEVPDSFIEDAVAQHAITGGDTELTTRQVYQDYQAYKASQK